MDGNMDANKFRKKIEVLDENHWQVLIGNLIGRTDLEISKSLFTTKQNVRKHYSRMFYHFEIPPVRGKKRPLLRSLLITHKDVLVEFLSDWDEVKLLIRIYDILGKMDKEQKLKLMSKSDSEVIGFLSKSLK